MAYIASIGLGIPKYEVTQEEVKELVKRLFKNNRKMERLLPVFDNAMVKKRQLAKDKKWYEQTHSFKEKNASYVNSAMELSLEAIDQCLNETKQRQRLSYESVDAIIFVSSSGISTPSLEAHFINERDFREDVVRMPLWGLGCAGGAMGLSRGYEWLQANPEKTALVVTCELCSMTFQKKDDSMSNIVGTAIFGDGAAATLLIGKESVYRDAFPQNLPVIKKTSSQTKKGTLNVMGWNVTDEGFEVIFSKKIPRLVPEIWKKHVMHFLKQQDFTVEEIGVFLAHPGGRKVLEAMQETLSIDRSLLRYAYEVLENHGNMSSTTVVYVLKKWLEAHERPDNKIEHALLCALGPGFSSEILLLERGNG